MRTFVATLAVGLTLLVCSSSAFADWSTPQVFGVSRYALTAVAVDARGDAAVAWARESGSSPVGRYRTSVHVTLRMASGRLLTRTLWSSNDARAEHVSVALGAGEATVIWASQSRAQTAIPILRADYGPLIGRWSPPRVIGRDPWEQGYPPTPHGFGDWFGHLAVAPDGEVLLTFNGRQGWQGSASAGEPVGVAVAWRAPGHPFGRPQVLREGPGGAVPQFDAHGTAYLSGYCNGFVLIAPSHTRQFQRTVVITRRPVHDFTLSLSGAAHGLAAWTDEPCSFDAEGPGPPLGPVFATILSAGTFGKPLELTPADTGASYSDAVAIPGGGTVTWVTEGPHGAGAFSLQIGAGGLPGATQQIAGGFAPIAADGGGDQVFTPLPGSLIAAPANPAVFVRPAGGGPDQPAPEGRGPASPETETVAARFGRAVAAAWNTSPIGGRPTMALSVWRP